jgi:hypothetical protein
MVKMVLGGGSLMILLFKKLLSFLFRILASRTGRFFCLSHSAICGDSSRYSQPIRQYLSPYICINKSIPISHYNDRDSRNGYEEN